MREHDVPAIFSESTVPADAAQQVARETGAAYGGVLYVDSLSEPGRAGADLPRHAAGDRRAPSPRRWRHDRARRIAAAGGRGRGRRAPARGRQRHLPHRPDRDRGRRASPSRAARSPRSSASTARASRRCSRRSWASCRSPPAASRSSAARPRAALADNLVAYVPQAEEVDWTFPVLVEDVVMMGRYGHMGWLRRPSAARPRARRRGARARRHGRLPPTGRSASCRAARRSGCSSPGRWRRRAR